MLIVASASASVTGSSLAYLPLILLTSDGCGGGANRIGCPSASPWRGQGGEDKGVAGSL